jgi:hypothetical protein
MSIRYRFILPLAGLTVMFSIASTHAAILAYWDCESVSTGQGAGACEAVSADTVVDMNGVEMTYYSSSGDIPLEPIFDDQPFAADSFTFSFNQGDSPPFNGLEDTTANNELEGEIVDGDITVTKVSDDDIKLEWDSIYPGSYPPLPAAWVQAAGANEIEGDVELDYDPMNSNYITSLDVALYAVPEPSSLWLLLTGLGGLPWLRRCGARPRPRL